MVMTCFGAGGAGHLCRFALRRRMAKVLALVAFWDSYVVLKAAAAETNSEAIPLP